MIREMLSESLWALLIAQTTLCIALGLAASFLARRSAAKAHQILLTALVAAVFTPGAYLLVRHFQLGVLASEATPISYHVTEPVESLDASVLDAPVMDVEYEPAPTIAAQEQAVAKPLPWDLICLLGWISLTAILLGRLALRFALGLRLLTTARSLDNERLRRAIESAAARLGIARPIRIRCSEKIKSPIIWCWTREPVLLVHARAATHPDGVDWVGIFCHELAHLKRRDHLSGLLAETLTALFPWHPLLWWVCARLAKLSEQACDDWVLAAGQNGVDYAETLLGLSAQRQMAFVPTVVGKEKTMSTRIRRIIKDRCGNPQISIRWAATVCLLAVLGIVSVGFAQRRPVEAREREIEVGAVQRAPQGRAEPAPDWQREVLQRKIDELVGQIQDKEAMLREDRNLPDEARRGKEFELDLMREMVAQLERRLRNFETPASRTSRRTEQQPRQEDELAVRRDRMERRLQTLTEAANDLEQALQREGDRDSDLRRDLEAKLDKMRQEIRQTEEELRNVEKRRQAQNPVAEQPRVVETRRRRGDSDPYGDMYGAQTRGDAMYGVREPARAEQDRNRTETRVYAFDRLSPGKIETIKEILSRLPQTDVTGIADKKVVVNSTAEVHRQIEKILQDFDDTAKPPLEAQVQDLRSQMQGLQERMEQMQKLLEQIAQDRQAPRTELRQRAEPR